MKNSTMTKWVASALMGAALVVAPQAVSADDAYPSKPVQLIVPYNPGGDTDLLGRLFASELEKTLGETVVVVNVAGASGSVATTKVKESDPDGYTMLFHHSGVLVSMLTGAIDFSYNDMTLLGSVGLSKGSIWVTGANSPYQDIGDVVKASKETPGSVKMGVNFGSQTHVHAVAFERAADVKLHMIDVGGIGEKIVAILGGHVDATEVQAGTVTSYLESGDMRVLGTTAGDRFEGMPDVKTFAEQGVDVAMPDRIFWVAMPAGVPQDVVDTMSKAIAEAGKSETLKAEYAKVKMTPYFLNAKETAEYLDAEYQFNDGYKEVFLSKK